MTIPEVLFFLADDANCKNSRIMRSVTTLDDNPRNLLIPQSVIKKSPRLNPKAYTSNEKTKAVGGGFEPPRGS